MDILLDIDLAVDYLTKDDANVQKLVDLVKEHKGNVWLSASGIGCLKLKSKEAGKEEAFQKFVSESKIFTVTPDTVRKSITEENVQLSIAYHNYKRIAPDGLVATKDAKWQEKEDAFSAEEATTKLKEQAEKAVENIPLLDLKAEYRHFLEDMDKAVLETIPQTRYIMGPQVKELEKKLGDFLGVKHCIGVASGTDALVLALRAISIQKTGKEYFNKEDQILTTPFTFTATGDAILRAGATPVFIDVDPKTFNIDPEKIKAYLAENKDKVVGMMPVHLYGQSCDMDQIMAIAEEHNLFVVEDVAQAYASKWKEKRAGAIGTAAGFSFFPSKNLGAFGDAGLVTTQDDEIGNLVRMLLKHGGKDKYNVDHIGYNSRLDTLQASIVLAKSKYIERFTENRRKIAEIYCQELKDVKGIILPAQSGFAEDKTHYHVFHQFTLRVQDGKRDELQKYLKEKNVGCMVYYPVPLQNMKVFANRCITSGEMTNANALTQEVLSLPVEPLFDKKMIKAVAQHIKDFMSK